MFGTPTLKETIQSTFPELTNLSGEGRTINRDRLSSVLEGLARDLTRAYWVRVIAAGAVMAALLVLMFKMAHDPKAFAAITAALGVSVGGAIAMLKQVTDEMARVRLLLALVPELTLEALTETSRQLWKKL